MDRHPSQFLELCALSKWWLVSPKWRMKKKGKDVGVKLRLHRDIDFLRMINVYRQPHHCQSNHQTRQSTLCTCEMKKANTPHLSFALFLHSTHALAPNLSSRMGGNALLLTIGYVS